MQAGATITPFLLVTGFLGSGKTTLINRWLRLAGGPRLGVVVNEFGQVGIDGALLQDRGDGRAILELANGCVCCVRGTEMWDAALELVDRAGAEVVLIETSGLVEPQALLDQYELLPPAMARRIDLRGLLCVVDPLHVSEAIGRRAEARHQIELSDRLLITKLDQAGPADVRGAHQTLDQLHGSRERAGLSLRAPDEEVAGVLRWALAPRAKGRRAGCHAGCSDACTHDGAGHRHGGKQLMAVSFQESQPLLAEPLLALFSELSDSSAQAAGGGDGSRGQAGTQGALPRGQILRAKGVVRVFGAPWAHDSAAADDADAPTLAALHLSGHRVELQPLSDGAGTAVPPGSSLVFIGEDLDEAWLRVRLSACRSTARAA